MASETAHLLYDGDRESCEDKGDAELVLLDGGCCSASYTGDGTLDLLGNPAIKSITGGPWTSVFILGCQMALVSANFGISYDLVLYMTRVLHEDNAGSTAVVNLWNGFTNLACLFGAVIADGFLGDYVTSGLFCIVAFIGSLLVTVSSIVPSLRPAPCADGTSVCARASATQEWVFNSALFIMGIGCGYQPSLVAFGADQYDENHKEENKQRHMYFSWYYLSMCFGSLFASIVLVNVEDKIGFGLGFEVSTAMIGIGIASLYCGTSYYRYRRARYNPFVGISKLFLGRFSNGQVKVPEYERMTDCAKDQNLSNQLGWSDSVSKQCRILDKGLEAIDGDTSVANPATAHPLSRKFMMILKLIPIWLSIIIYGALFGQMASVFVLQGSFMNTRVGAFIVPPAMLNMADVAAVILVTFAYEYMLDPFISRLTGKGITKLQRIGVGQFCMALAMGYAALLERERLQLLNPPEGVAASNLNVLWQIPQYAFVGASEVFAYLGHIEFFYDQSPEGAQSFGTALSFSAMAMGGFLGGLFVTVIQNITGSIDGRIGWIPQNIDHGHLDYYYAALTMVSCFNFVYFLVAATLYRYKQAPAEKVKEDALECS